MFKGGNGGGNGGGSSGVEERELNTGGITLNVTLGGGG